MLQEMETNKRSQYGRMTRAQIRAMLDKFGWYQQRVLLLMIYPNIMLGYNTLSVVLTFFSPDHRCRVPGVDNDTYSIQNEAHRMMVNLSIPMTLVDGDVSYSQCEVYKDRDAGHVNRTLYDETEPCDSWVYDDTEFDRTIVTQFDLVCDNRGFRANFNMIFMLGLLAGSAVSGILCDRLGRKRIFIVSVALNTVVYTAMAFPGVAPLLLVYRFLGGTFSMASALAAYVLVLEFMGPSWRTMAASLMGVSWVIGPFVVGGLSYLITDWRWLQVINGVSRIFIISYWWLLDESPRWLLIKGRSQEAREVILKVMKRNKMTLPAESPTDEGSLGMEDTQEHNTVTAQSTDQQENTHGAGNKDMACDTHTETIAKTQKETKIKRDQTELDKADKQNQVMDEEDGREMPPESPLKLLKFPNLIARTGIIFFNWSAVSTTYYGLSLNVANLGGSVRLNFMFSTLVEMVGTFAAWFLLERLGRKRTHCTFMLVAGLSCLATIFSVMFGGSDLHWVTVLLVMVGKLGISAAFTTVYLMSGELFPTVIRNMGMGSSSTVARVTTAMSPYIADLSLHIEGNLGRALPLVIFGALALAAGLLALCLPETLNRKLPDTILEAADFTKKGSNNPVHVKHVKADSGHSP